MSTRTLIVLVVLGIVAIAGGWYFGVDTIPSEQQTANSGKLMFPNLTQRLQQAVKVVVVHQGQNLVIEKRTVQGHVHWGVASRDYYPVRETKLRSMLTALTELRLMDQRTSDPKQYATLGVEDPGSPTSQSDLLRVLDASGKPIAALIVGHRRVRSGGNVPDEVYVRRPGSKQSWLAEGSLQVDSDPQLWLDRDIMNIDHSRIAKVTVTRDGATLEFTRDDDKLALTQPANHPKLDNYKLQDVSRALELLTFDDVQAEKAPRADPIGTSVFTTSDGLAVTASLYQAPTKPNATVTTDHKVLAQFTVTGTGKSKAEADRLQARLSGWTYELGAWKQSSLVPSLSDLTEPPSARPAAAAAAGAKP